jgi:hypothetical protein
MRWLMIGLLVSVGALVFASAGMAYHIWRQRALLRQSPQGFPHGAQVLADEVDVETEEAP